MILKIMTTVIILVTDTHFPCREQEPKIIMIVVVMVVVVVVMDNADADEEDDDNDDDDDGDNKIDDDDDELTKMYVQPLVRSKTIPVLKDSRIMANPATPTCRGRNPGPPQRLDCCSWSFLRCVPPRGPSGICSFVCWLVA